MKAREVVMTGHIAWVAQNLDGMTALDLSNVTKPKIVRRFRPDEIQPLGITVLPPHHLIIADRFRGLVIWDVSRADRPTSLSCLAVSGVPSDVSISSIGRRRVAALACAGEGLAVTDITNLRKPVLESTFTMRVDYSRRLQLDGNLCYLADHFDGGLKVLDLASPGQPSPLFQVTLPGFCEAVNIQGNLVTVGYRNYGTRFFKLTRSISPSDSDLQTTPALEHLCTIVRSNSRVRTVESIHGNWLAIANDEAGLELYDTSNPRAPLLAAEHAFASPEQSAQSVRYYQGCLLVPAWDGGLYIFKLVI